MDNFLLYDVCLAWRWIWLNCLKKIDKIKNYWNIYNLEIKFINICSQSDREYSGVQSASHKSKQNIFRYKIICWTDAFKKNQENNNLTTLKLSFILNFGIKQLCFFTNICDGFNYFYLKLTVLVWVAHLICQKIYVM